jgi:hypothetical protein
VSIANFVRLTKAESRIIKGFPMFNFLRQKKTKIVHPNVPNMYGFQFSQAADLNGGVGELAFQPKFSLPVIRQENTGCTFRSIIPTATPAVITRSVQSYQWNGIETSDLQIQKATKGKK